MTINNRLSEAHKTAILQAALDCIISIDHEGRIIEFNPAAERTFGYRREDVLGREIAEVIILPSLRERHHRGLPRYLATEEGPLLNRVIEMTAVRADGTEFPVEFNVTCIPTDGPPIFTAYLRDITARMRAEEALRESEERLHLALEAARTGIWSWDMKGMEIFWSDEVYQLHGLAKEDFADSEEEDYAHLAEMIRPDEVAGLLDFVHSSRRAACLLEIIHPDDLAQGFGVVYQAMKTGNDYEIEYRVQHGDGSTHWMYVQGRLYFDEDGELVRMAGTVQDVTERKQADELLRRSERELADFFENATIGLHWVGPDGIILRVNQAELDLLGYSREEYVGHHIAEFHVNQGIIDDILTRLTCGETLQEYPARLRCKDGSIRDVLINSSALFEEEEFIHTRCFTLDITERKRAEQALRQSKERYRAIVEGHAEMVCRFRPDGTILFVNGAYARARGTTPDTLIRANFWDFIEEEDRPVVQALLDRLRPESPEIRIENRFETAEGVRWMLWTNHGLAFDADGRAMEVQSSGIDITDRKQAEQALRELNETLEERVEERTRQVHALARRLTMAEQEERRRISQILHDDLQQLLYGVEVKVGMLRRNLQQAEHPELAGDLEKARGWIRQAITTLRQLTVDLSPPILKNEGLVDALEWLQRQMKELHGLEVALEAEHNWYIRDEDLRVLLFQIVRELLFNVKKHAGTRRATVRLTEEGEHLVIHVIDEGQGFDLEEVEAREEHAVGFGLFSVRERLGLLDGHLEIRSQPGEGTHIKVHAPV